MKVIVLTGEPIPNGMATSNRIKCFARAIKEGGLDCEVLVYRRTEVFRRKPRNIEGHGSFNEIPFHYIGDTPLRGKNLIFRLYIDRVDCWRTEKYLRRNLNPGDVVFFVMERVELMLRFVKIAQRKGAFCVRDLCELPYGTGIETKLAVYLRNITFRKQLPNLDGIISISDSLLNLAKQYTPESCKHIKVPILVDYEHYCMSNGFTDAHAPYIFHSGTLYEQKDGILGMLEAFGKASKRLSTPILFESTGLLENSPHKEEIKKILKQYQIEDRVFFRGYLSNDELKEYLRKASLVIVNKYPTQQNRYCFSTKLGEYLAAAKPVIITNVGEAMNWLTDRDSAYVIEPNDVNVLAETIVHVFTHPLESINVGKGGQEVCRCCFDYRNWSLPLVLFFKQLEY